MGVVLGTAGHIDHGKTALVRALTGVDTDRLPEEKARGITIDIGFAHMDVPLPDGASLRVGIVDVPGHERFIRNMLAGASGIDAALLVVAADDSVMPQTREHLAILKLLGIPRGVIALTKTDLVEPSWTDLVEEEVRELVRGSFLESAAIVRTSAATGAGIGALREAIAACCAAAGRLRDRGLFRLPVDRSFVKEGLGTIVTGTVWSGALSVGDEVEWLPTGKRVRVRGLQSHGRSVDHVEAGDRAAVNLIGAHHAEITRGHELATPGYLHSSRRMTASLEVLPESPWGVRHRSRVRLHVGSGEVIAQVRLLRGQAIGPGESGLAQLVCAESVSCVNGQPLVIRAESPMVTLGGGVVLQPMARPVPRRRKDLIDRVQRLGKDEAERTAAAAGFMALSPWGAIDLSREAGVGLARAEALLMEMRASGDLIDLPVRGAGTIPVHRERLVELRERVRRATTRLHEASPLLRNVPRVQVVQMLAGAAGGEAVASALVDRFVEEGVLRSKDEGVAFAEFAPRLSKGDKNLRDKVLKTIEAGGFSPPTVEELCKATGVNMRQLSPILELCVAEGELTPIAPGFWLSAASEHEARRRVTEALRERGSLTVADIRDVLGTSRKYAVPLCEYLDTVGVTRREGDVRLAGPCVIP